MALLLLVLCGACWHLVPVADARGHAQGSGPPADAYPLAGERSLALDPWGFVARQCTSYVAWHLNAHGTPFGVLTLWPVGGGLFTSAGSWDLAAAAAGFLVRHTPAVGSIAQWDPGEASPAAPARALHDGGITAGRHGHVAVVRRVFGDGSVLVTGYDGETGTFQVRVTRAPRYLYIGVPVPTGSRVPPSARPAGSARTGPPGS